MINIFIDFVIIFILVFLIYLLFLNRKKKDFNKLNDNDFIKIFVKRYNININKINYKYMVTLISLCNSFIIAFTSVIILNIESIIWSIIVCFVVLFALIYSMFEILGKHIKNTESKVRVVKTKNKKKKEDDK